MNAYLSIIHPLLATEVCNQALIVVSIVVAVLAVFMLFVNGATNRK